MEHHFNTDIACEFSVIEAIFINHFQFWIIKNYADKQNFYDGRTWTYNSVLGLKEIFPYLSDKQIRSTLDKLVEKGVLIKGNYNSKAFDRTLWYAFANEEKWIFQKGQMHLTKRANGIAQNGEPIPYNNTDIETHISPINPPKGECECEVVEEVDSNEMKFEEFRKMYKGTKRGHDKEWQNFVKKYKKRINEIIPILIPSYEAQLKYRDDSRRNGCFVPQEQNMQTWINNEGWSYELHFEQQTRPGTQQGADWNTHEGLQRQHQVDELTQKLWDSI